MNFNYENNYNVARRPSRKSLREKMFCYIVICILSLICFGQLYYGIFKTIKIDSLISQNEILSNELLEKEERIKGLEDELKVAKYNNEYQTSVISSLKETNDELDKQLVDIAKKNDRLNEIAEQQDKAIEDLTDRVNTYEEYEYALFYGNERNDLTYEQLKLGEDLMQSKGYDPDLLFGIIMVESGGKERAINPSTNASGYGQFLESTGRYIYEDVMKEGKYNHNVTPRDGDTNIKMIATYLDFLYEKYDGNIVNTLKEYCGSSDYSKTYSYMNKINTHIDTNVYTMSVNN